MKLHKRTIRIAAGQIIQVMTPTGKIVAEFHDPMLWNVFMTGLRKPQPDITVYDEDTGVTLIATLDELLNYEVK